MIHPLRIRSKSQTAKLSLLNLLTLGFYPKNLSLSKEMAINLQSFGSED